MPTSSPASTAASPPSKPKRVNPMFWRISRVATTGGCFRNYKRKRIAW